MERLSQYTIKSGKQKNYHAFFVKIKGGHKHTQGKVSMI